MSNGIIDYLTNTETMGTIPQMCDGYSRRTDILCSQSVLNKSETYIFAIGSCKSLEIPTVYKGLLQCSFSCFLFTSSTVTNLQH